MANILISAQYWPRVTCQETSGPSAPYKRGGGSWQTMMGIESRSQQTLGFYYDTDLWVIDTRTADRHTSDDDQDLVTTSDQISVSWHSLILDKSYDKRLLTKKNLQMNSHLFILIIICSNDSLISLQRNSTLKVMTLKHPITCFPLTINDHFKCFFPLHKSILSLELTNSLCCPLLTSTFSRNKSVWRKTQVCHALI